MLHFLASKFFFFFFLFFLNRLREQGRDADEVEVERTSAWVYFTFANQAFGADDDEADRWSLKLAWKGWSWSWSCSWMDRNALRFMFCASALPVPMPVPMRLHTSMPVSPAHEKSQVSHLLLLSLLFPQTAVRSKKKNHSFPSHQSINNPTLCCCCCCCSYSLASPSGYHPDRLALFQGSQSQS